jgi:hypothetical protein
MIVRAIGFDCETWPFRPGCMTPPAISLQWSSIECDRVHTPVLLGGRESYRQLIDVFVGWLRTPGTVLYGANVAYDVLCMVSLAGRVYGYEAAQALLVEVFAKYRASEVGDVLTNQKMIDLAAGCYRGYYDDKGKWYRYGYALDDVCLRHTGRKLNKGEWERRFGELENVPLFRWPQGATAYALDDGLATSQVTVEQTNYPRTVDMNFPGLDPLVDQFTQARAGFWLKLISTWGIRTRADAVAKFSQEVEIEYDRLANELADDRVPMRSGPNKALVYREYKLDRKAIVDRARHLGKLDRLIRKGEHGESVVTLAAEPLLSCGDPLLSLVAIWREIKRGLEERRDPKALEAFELLRLNKLATCEFHRSTKAAADRMIQVCTAQNRDVRMTEKDGIALDKETCDASGDPLLQAYADLSSLSKTVSNDVPALRSGTYYPIHTRYEEYLDTNRTSSSNPNIQNIRRLPGIRECFVPRDGCVLIDADYKMLELYCLAQVCIWKLGWSALAETLKSGQDPHLKVGATMLGLDYPEALRRYQAGDGEVSNARDCGKVADFGIPGGLGPDTLVTYAAKSYGVKIDREKAVEIRDWFYQTFPEVRDYMRVYVASLETYPDSGSYNVIDPYSGRLRAGATFCAACNDGFQGLGANVAKLAGWYIAEAAYIVPQDPLFGCRPVNFIHDQWLVEAPEHRAEAAAGSLVHHMNRAAEQVLPDCPTRASVLISRVWSKKAKKVLIDGRMVPWEQEPERAMVTT